MSEEKVRENRARRKLDRMGCKLAKSRRRDPDAADYGLYAIIDLSTGGALAGINTHFGWYEMTLEDVEEWIKESREE